jgi:hypothetical protein
MAAGVYNLSVEQGVTRSFDAQYKTPNGVTPVDLTGFSGRGHIKISKSSCDILGQFAVTVTNPIEGRFNVTLPASAFIGKTLRTKRADGLVEAYYDIELFTADDARVIRVLEGMVLISLEITK